VDRASARIKLAVREERWLTVAVEPQEDSLPYFQAASRFRKRGGVKNGSDGGCTLSVPTAPTGRRLQSGASRRPESMVSRRRLREAIIVALTLPATELAPILRPMDQPREIELVFAPQDEGGYHVYAPDLPGLHTEGDTLDEATANAQEALALYVEGMREDGRSLDTGVIRRKFPVPA
jgi:predicted RNase H-like HicB family nuclease